MNGEVKIEMSLAINELAAALAKAQGEMGHAVKDATNPHFKSNYADLASVWDACRAAFSKNGLSVTQPTTNAPEGVTVVTLLMHASGQWIKSELTLPVAQRTAQAYGSAITYGRRYGLAAAAGVAADDDDGNAATAAAPATRPASSSRTSAAKEKLKASTKAADAPAGETKPPPNFSNMSTPALELKIKDLEAWLVRNPNNKDAPAARERLYDCQIELANRQDALKKEHEQEGAPA